MVSVRGCRGWSAVAVVATLGWAAGCGEVPPDDSGGAIEDEDVTTVRAALSSTEFSDGTGTIVVKVKTCDPASSTGSGSNHNACAICIMDSGWARVGGGAEIIGEASPGPQLVVSRADWFQGTSPPSGCSGAGEPIPNQTNNIWIARSRGPVSHQLRAYAIGMKVRNTNGVLVAPSITFPVDNVGGFSGNPATASVTVDTVSIQNATGISNQIVVGGGAEVVPNTANAYLTESAPVNTVNGLGWRAGARYASGTPDGGVKAWVVGLEPCPAAWNGACFHSPIGIREAIAAATSGYGTASYTLPSSWVTPVVGGKAPTSSGSGRYLADLIPFNGSSRGARVRSKASGGTSSGPTHAYAIALGRNQATYTFNSVRFNHNGYTLYRPSGSNPTLQQHSTPGDTSSKRWHLENLGSGVYRIRNGNPDSGSECAYRVGTTSVVRVTTCGTGNEFKWTALSGTIYTGPFQLKNATSSTLCLDNNGLAGASPSDLIMKTCSAFSNSQLLFLDVYNWPPS